MSEGGPKEIPRSAVRRDKPKSTVARRITASYIAVLTAFAITMGLSIRDMRASARDGELLRSGYVPLELSLDEALSEQNILATQLNHVTSVKNPADVREWIDTATRARPTTLAAARRAAEKLSSDDPVVNNFRADVFKEIDSIGELLEADTDAFGRLFQLLSVNERAEADRVHGEIVKRDADAAQKLRQLKAHVEENMNALRDVARLRESWSLRLLLGLSALTMLVGLGISLYARRILRPLSHVTDRAKAVAGGDLTAHEVVTDRSEIGELARTFENMVLAIRAARQDLVHAERLATIGKMAAHITHEIRNPLSSIGLNLELLEGELAEEDAGVLAGHDAKSIRETRELLAAIKSETARLSRISEQYLGVARRPSPTLEVESVADVVRELLAFVKPELDKAKVTFALEIDDSAPEVPIDEPQLRQALLNLVRNAREAMVDGGELKISVQPASGGGVDLSIEDEGPGIPEEARAAIFDPFFTTKQRGTGLGLAVTREIIEAHGGVIACEPRVPKGTRFVIHLPNNTERLPSARPSSSEYV